MVRRVLSALLVVVFAALALSCAQAPKPAAPRQRLVVAATHRPFAALFPIARERGFFAARGLDVEIRPYTTGNAAIADVISGRVDVGMASDFGYASAAVGSDGFRILAQVANGVDHQMVVLKGSGLTTPRDLAGKRVGVRAGAAQFTFMLSRLLAESGVSSETVTVVSVPETQTATALLERRVDAMITWAPLPTADAEALAGRVDVWSLASVAKTWSLVCVSPSTLAARGPAVREFLAALVDAQYWAEQHPDEAVAIARAWSGQPDAYGSGWPVEALYVDLSQTSVVRIEEEARWIERTTGVRPKAPVESLVAPEPLRAVDPALVTILAR
ncbi:MAG: ABC transporter substrate-binding protein [Coriobacteriia bacterium]|nr:ABC transporter substrate-binding protein [Coriobacteriia bacterium]